MILVFFEDYCQCKRKEKLSALGVHVSDSRYSILVRSLVTKFAMSLKLRMLSIVNPMLVHNPLHLVSVMRVIHVPNSTHYLKVYIF